MIIHFIPSASVTFSNPPCQLFQFLLIISFLHTLPHNYILLLLHQVFLYSFLKKEAQDKKKYTYPYEEAASIQCCSCLPPALRTEQSKTIECSEQRAVTVITLCSAPPALTGMPACGVGWNSWLRL